MIRTKLFTAALVVSASTCALQSAGATPGYRTANLDVSHRTKPLELHIWYPADQEGEITRLGKNAVFTGVEVRRDASPTEGKHPLVLLSHGSGGNAVNIAWIAAELADRGMVVVATNHPGTTSRDSHPDQTIKLWERPADLSSILDKATSAGFGPIQIDGTKVGAVGFSLGGHTVLGIAGARVRKAKYVDYCNRFSAMQDCAWLSAGGVKFNEIDATPFEQSNRDARFKAVVAIDPALSQAYDDESLKDVTVPVRLINLGDDNQVPAGINASEISASFPNAQLINIQQATHFSFLGECTKIGEAIIKSEGEDAICSETWNRKRADIHAELKTRIGEFLQEQLLKE